MFAGVETLPGIGPKAAEALESLNVTRPRDLLFHLPTAGIARRTVARLADLRPPEGVRILNDPGQAVATVSPPMASNTRQCRNCTPGSISLPVRSVCGARPWAV